MATLQYVAAVCKPSTWASLWAAPQIDVVGFATYATPHRFYMIDRFSRMSVYRRPFTKLPRRGRDK
jgi:hypothetical protein